MRSNGIEGNYRCCIPKLISKESPVTSVFQEIWLSKPICLGSFERLKLDVEMIWGRLKRLMESLNPIKPLEIWATLHLEIAIPWQHRDACKVVGQDRTWKLGVFHSCQEELSKFQMEKTWNNLQDPKISSIFRFNFFHSERVFTASKLQAINLLIRWNFQRATHVSLQHGPREWCGATRWKPSTPFVSCDLLLFGEVICIQFSYA